MEMTGEHRIAAPRDRVWAALNDPAILMQAIPGCESLARREDDAEAGFDATVAQRIGPIQARFKGKVTLADLVPPESYTLKGEGSGGAAGFAKGEARIRLEPDGTAATRLVYSVKATVGGKLAQIGQRLIDQTARSLADEFFVRFSGAVAPPAAAPSVPAPQAAATPPEGGLSPALWVAGFILITLALVAAFAML
jgi:uncharacterized protein